MGAWRRAVAGFLCAGLFCVAGGAWAQELSFKRGRFFDILSPVSAQSAPGASDLPLGLTYPADFVLDKRTIGAQGMSFLRSPTTDLDRFLAGAGEESLGQGFFVVRVSMNVGYRAGANRFSGEGDPAEREKMEKAGLSQIVTKRVDQAGVPVYALTAVAPSGRHVYMAYIALGDSGSVLHVSYNHPKQYSTRDDRIWQAFIDGLGASKKTQ